MMASVTRQHLKSRCWNRGKYGHDEHLRAVIQAVAPAWVDASVRDHVHLLLALRRRVQRRSPQLNVGCTDVVSRREPICQEHQ